MECCSLMFMFLCNFQAGVSGVLSGLEQLFSSIPHPLPLPPPPPPLLSFFFIIILHSTDLISVDGCPEWGSWLDCEDLQAMGAVFYLGTGWTQWKAPTFHLSEVAVNGVTMSNSQI